MFSKLLCAAIAGVVVGQNNDTTTTSAAAAAGNDTTTSAAAAADATTTTTPAPAVLLGTLEVLTTDTWNITASGTAPGEGDLNNHAVGTPSYTQAQNPGPLAYFNAKMAAMQAGVTKTMSSANPQDLVKGDMSFTVPSSRRLSSHSQSLVFVTKATVMSQAGLTVSAIASAKSAAAAAVSNDTFAQQFTDAFKTTMETQAALNGIAIDVGTPQVSATLPVDNTGTSAAAPVVAGVSAVLAMLATLF